jgi:hypothetical protein
LGSSSFNSKNHGVGNLLSYKRGEDYIYNLDKIILNMFYNKNIIKKIVLSSRRSKFLFLSSKENYFNLLSPIADSCYESSAL